MLRLCRAASAALILVSFAVACGREEAAPPPAPTPAPSAVPAAPPAAAEAFRVSRIDLGNAVDGEKRVAAPSTVFAPADTIYASVVTEGASPSVTLVARWTFEDGQLVSQGSQTIAPSGPAATEFHIAKPDGWPAGRYQVEVVANGQSAGARTFEVRE